MKIVDITNGKIIEIDETSIKEICDMLPNKQDITKMLIMIDVLDEISDKDGLCELRQFISKLNEDGIYDEKAYGMLWANRFIDMYDPEPPELIDLTEAGKMYRGEYWRTGPETFIHLGNTKIAII